MPQRPAQAELEDSPTDINKAGWRAILKRSIQQFKHDAVTDRAAALTYFGVLAIFPGLLVLISVMGLSDARMSSRCSTIFVMSRRVA